MSALRFITKRRLSALNAFDMASILVMVFVLMPLFPSWLWLMVVVLWAFVGSAISVELERYAR